MNRFAIVTYMTIGAGLVLIGTLLPEAWLRLASPSVRILVAALTVGTMLLLSRRATALRRPMNVAYDEVTAKRFVITNDKDVPVVEVASNETGGTIEIRATDGTVRARVRVQDNGGTVRLYGPASPPLLTLGVANRESGYLRISGVNGESRVELAVKEDTGVVQVCASDGVARSVLRVLRDGGSLRILDNQGNTRAEIRADVHHALFHIYNKEGDPRVEMGVDDQGGIIGVVGQDGKPRARVRETEGCGVIRVMDSQGRVVGDFGGEGKAGYLKLLDLPESLPEDSPERRILCQLPEQSKKSAKSATNA